MEQLQTRITAIYTMTATILTITKDCPVKFSCDNLNNSSPDFFIGFEYGYLCHIFLSAIISQQKKINVTK
jgi:hypothetical protein